MHAMYTEAKVVPSAKSGNENRPATFRFTLRPMLCESTVEMARMAPSDVDIDAALIPISTQQPNQVGI